MSVIVEDLNPKNESVLKRFASKLLGTDKPNTLFDIEGNEIGEFKDGRVYVEGKLVNSRVTFDDED